MTIERVMLRIETVALSCVNCSGSLNLNPEKPIVTCDYCGTPQRVLISNDGKNISLAPFEKELDKIQGPSQATAAKLDLSRLSKELSVVSDSYLVSFQNLQLLTQNARRTISASKKVFWLLGIGQVAILFLSISETNFAILESFIVIGCISSVMHKISSEKALDRLKKKYVPEHRKLLLKYGELKKQIEKNIPMSQER